MMLNESMFEDYNEWTYVSSKDVRDTDGFITDYTWYKRLNKAGDEEHVFIFGDSDIYGPYDSTPDYETDSQERAQEWFNNYRGFDDDDLDEGLNYKDFESFKKIADEIGLKTAGDIERFRREYVEEGESDLDAIKRYRAELGDDFKMIEGFFDNSVGKLDVSEAERAMKYHTVTYSTQIFELLNRRYDVVGLKSRGDDSTGSILIKGLKKDITSMLNKKLAPIGSYDKVEFRKQVDGLYTFELSSDVETDTTQTNAQELKGKEYLDSATDAYLVSSLDKSKYSNKQLTEETEQELVASQKKKFAEYQEKLNEVNKKIEELLDKKRKYDNAKPEEKKFMDSIGYLDGVKSSMSDYEQKQKHYMKEMEVLDQLIKNGGNYKVEVEDPKLVSEGLEDKSLETLCANYNFICNELTVDELEGFGIDELMNMYEGDVKYFCVDTGDGQQVVVAVSDEGRITIEEDTDGLGFGIGDEYRNAQVFMKTYLKYAGKEELEEALPAIAAAAIAAAASGAGARLVDKIFGESVATGQRGRYQVEVFDEGDWHKLNCWSTIAKAIKAGEAAVEAVYQDYRVIDKESGSEVELYEGFLDKFKKKKKAVKYGLYNRYGRMIYGPFDSQVEAQIEYEAQTKYSDKYANELTVRPLDEVDYKRYVTEGFQSKATSAEIAHEIAIKARRAFNLSAYEVETLEHDINNLRADEWVDQFEQLSPKSKLRKLFFDNAVAEETEELNERYLSGRYVWCEYKDVKGMNIYQLCKYIEELYKNKFGREVKVSDAIDQSYDYSNKELPFIVEADLGDEESVKGCDGFWFIVNCTEEEAKKLQGADLNESATDLDTKKNVLNQLRDDLRLLLTCETLVDVEKLNDKFNVFDALNTVKTNIENGMSEEDAVNDAQGYLMQRTATLQKEIISAKNASIKPVNESVDNGSKYVYFFPYIGARQLTKEQALKMARDKLKLMEESSGAGEVGQGFAIYCVESTDNADTWTARNDAKEFIKSLTESFDVDKVQKRIASTSEFDNGYVFFDYEKMTSDEAEKKAKQMSIDDPTRVFYVKYDDIMNPSSDIFWKNGEQVDYRGRKLEQPVVSLQEGRMKELATEIENEGGKDKWLAEMSKRIAEMRDMLSYLKTEAPREVNRGGNFDSYEELAEAVADIEKELDELLVKVQAVA